MLELAHSDLDLDALASLDDDEVIAALTSVRGLGRWTADWFLARHLARPHAWPAGDLGVRKAVSTFYAAGRSLTIEEVRRMSERFAPFENLSAQFLLAGARMAGSEHMNVRRAAAEDFDAIAELWKQFDHELPPPTHEGPADVEQELGEVREIIASEIAFVAEDEGTPVGFALARRRAPGFGTLTDLYVAQDARRSGIATELMREVLAAFRSLGIGHLDLDVLASNNVARSLYARWGLKDEVVIMTGRSPISKPSSAARKPRRSDRSTSSPTT